MSIYRHTRIIYLSTNLNMSLREKSKGNIWKQELNNKIERLIYRNKKHVEKKIYKERNDGQDQYQLQNGIKISK